MLNQNIKHALILPHTKQNHHNRIGSKPNQETPEWPGITKQTNILNYYFSLKQSKNTKLKRVEKV